MIVVTPLVPLIVPPAAAGVNASAVKNTTVATAQCIITVTLALNRSIVTDMGLYDVLLEPFLLLVIEEVSG